MHELDALRTKNRRLQGINEHLLNERDAMLSLIEQLEGLLDKGGAEIAYTDCAGQRA